jgi:adenylyltransferase/sulfurtransferase
VLQYLCGAGVGHIGCVDFDRVELHNLHRQLLFNRNSVGSQKITIAKEVLAAQRPAALLDFKNQRLTADNAAALVSGYDLVVDGSDNFKTRYIVSDTCKILNIPVIYGSILGFEGQLAVFGHEGGKTLRDLFASPPVAGNAPNCAENGVLATLPGIIGLLMAQEALKLVMGLPVLHNQLVLLDTLHFEWRKLHF